MNNPFQPLIKSIIDALSKYSIRQEDLVGVDITPNFIRVAQLTEDKNGWLLEKLGSKLISEKYNLSDIREHQEIYVEHLRDLVVSAKLETANVAISIPITSAIIRAVTLPLMSDEEIQSAIEYDSLWGNIIQLAEKLEEYSIFWQVIKRNPAENTMELLFVASKLSEINQYVQIATKAGLNPVVVDVRCFAIRNALKTHKTNSRSTIALIEIGPNENYVLVVTENAPFIHDIYVSESDRLLIENGIPSGEVGDRFYDRISDQVRQAFRTYEAKFSSGLIDKVLLVSPISNISQLLVKMQSCLDGYRVEAFNPTLDIQIPLNLSAQFKSESNISVFSSVIGLATRKVDIFGYYKYVTGVNNVNLLPNRDMVKNVERNKIISRLGMKLGAAFAVCFVLGTVGYQFYQSKELDGDYIKAVDLEQQVLAREAVLTQLKAKKAQYSQMLEASKEFKSNQRSSYRLLEEVNHSVPGGVWFTEIVFDSPVTLVIKGDAANDQVIVNLVDRLHKLPMIDKASLQTMNIKMQSPSKRGGGAKQFEVRCLIKPDVDESAVKVDGNRAPNNSKIGI